jgi:transposase
MKKSNPIQSKNNKKISALEKTVSEMTLQISMLLKRVGTLAEENRKLKEENIFLRKENAEFKEEIKRLKEKMSKNSSNSSKPPSTDIGRKNKNNSHRSNDKKSGGQSGHSGKILNKAETADITKHLMPDKCTCGHTFTGNETKSKTKSRQVFDIPEPKIEVTEYISAYYECSHCKLKHRKEFPDHVKTSVQYGKRFKSFAVYLMNYQLLPYKRTAKLFDNLFEFSVSEGTLYNILSDYGSRLDEPLDMIKSSIINSETVHFDESGFYSESGRDWIHVASTGSYTYYHYHKSRGLEALKELDYFKGTAVHDYWITYYKYDKCSHSLYNAHHLRDLQGIYDSAALEWAKEMKNLLSEMKTEVDKAKAQKKTMLSDNVCLALTAKFDKLIEKGYSTTPVPKQKKKGTRGKQKRGKTLCLLDRFKARSKEILDFIFDFSKPFDNNQAERDIRMTKVKQKISGTFRNSNMAQTFCRIRSFISTAIKQSVNVLQAIEGIYENKNFISVQV